MEIDDHIRNLRKIVGMLTEGSQERSDLEAAIALLEESIIVEYPTWEDEED